MNSSFVVGNIVPLKQQRRGAAKSNLNLVPKVGRPDNADGGGSRDDDDFLNLIDLREIKLLAGKSGISPEVSDSLWRAADRIQLRLELMEGESPPFPARFVA